MAHDTFADHIPRRRGQLVLEVVPPLVSIWNIHLTLRIIDNNPFLGPFSLMPGLAIRARWLDDKPAGTQHPKLIRMGEVLRKYGWPLVALSRSGMHQHSPWSKRDMAGSMLPRFFPFQGETSIPKSVMVPPQLSVCLFQEVGCYLLVIPKNVLVGSLGRTALSDCQAMAIYLCLLANKAWLYVEPRNSLALSAECLLNPQHSHIGEQGKDWIYLSAEQALRSLVFSNPLNTFQGLEGGGCYVLGEAFWRTRPG